MKWSVKIDEKGQYAELITGGVADKNNSLDMAKAIASTLCISKIKKILIDHRNIVSVSGNAIDVYSRPKQLEEMGVIHGIRIAEIIKPEHKEFFKFFETVCVNRGYSFSIFHNKKTALEWLLKDESKRTSCVVAR